MTVIGTPDAAAMQAKRTTYFVFGLIFAVLELVVAGLSWMVSAFRLGHL